MDSMAVCWHSLKKATKAAGASVGVIAPKIGGVQDSSGAMVEGDFSLSGGPSVFFDACALLTSREGAADLATQAGAVDWVANAYTHLKVMGHSADAQPLLDRAGSQSDERVIPPEQLIFQTFSSRVNWERRFISTYVLPRPKPDQSHRG